MDVAVSFGVERYNSCSLLRGDLQSIDEISGEIIPGIRSREMIRQALRSLASWWRLRILRRTGKPFASRM
jgi:hypothetical protein